MKKNTQQFLQGLNKSPRPQGPVIDPNTLKERICSVCRSPIFIRTVGQRAIPVTHPQNTSGQEMTMYLETFSCLKCMMMDAVKEALKNEFNTNYNNGNVETVDFKKDP